MKATLVGLLMILHTSAVAQWMYVTNDGSLITGQQTQVTCTDPKTGVIKWTYSSPDSALITGVDPILDLPYIRLQTSVFTIFDPSTGNVIIDPQLFNDVYRFGFMYDTNLWMEAS